MLDPVEALKEKMVLACKVLQKQRVIDGYGHLTARLPGAATRCCYAATAGR